MEDGFSADQIFGTHTGYTYDDLVVLPGHVSFDSNKVHLICTAAKAEQGHWDITRGTSGDRICAADPALFTRYILRKDIK